MKLTINDRRCKGCNLCVKVCPYAIFQEGTVPGPRGYIIPHLNAPQRCTNCRLQVLYGRQLCGMCQTICPDQAISWVEEKPCEPKKVVIEY